MVSIQALRTTFIALTATLAIGAAMPGPSVAIGENADADFAVAASNAEAGELPVLTLKDALVLEDREGYNSEYIFGMTKAVLNSTLHPALKPLTCLVTVPLDLAVLPFSVLLGAF